MAQISLDLEGGPKTSYEHPLLLRGPVVMPPETAPIWIESLDHGMQGGKPSLALIIELSDFELVVCAQTTVRLFQMAAYATMARYGDLTEGGILGSFSRGKSAT